jgi:hypothetical protein
MTHTPRDVERPPQADPGGTSAPLARKPFVEPEISVPVDVLEATTFFQALDSGATGFVPDPDSGPEGGPPT